MRELFTVIQSCPDSEAQEIYQMVRAEVYGNDVRALVLHSRQTVLKRGQSDLQEPRVR
jgi:CRISPR/Cas system-associated endonuclease/helicase Cas3